MIETLRQGRTEFGRIGRTRKYHLIQSIGRQSIRKPEVARAWHDLLLFLSAYPDDSQFLRQVNKELDRLALTMLRSQSEGTRGLTNLLSDSGIAHTETVHPFTLDMMQWLTRRFPKDLCLDWDDDSLGDAFDEFAQQIVPRVERDGLYADDLTTREWFAHAMGKSKLSDAAWIAEQFQRLRGEPALRDHAFDSLNLSTRWKLCNKAASRTFCRFPSRPIFFQNEPILRHVDLNSIAAKPLAGAEYVAARKAEAILDACRTTLCVRHREIDTLTYANPREVSLFQLERGIDVAVFGMTPERRLPIESYFGFVVARNRVPIGYGGGWVFLDRCEIGVNIFDEFRGGESAFAFAQVIRVYRQFFRTTRFLVDPFQFGAGNREAIASGAFWFYYRLGFRPIDARLCRRADAEAAKLQANPKCRTPGSTLRTLARAKLFMDFSRKLPESAPAPDLTRIGLALTAWLGRRFKGDRATAEAWCANRVMKILNVKPTKNWSGHEKTALEQMSLLIAPMNSITKWQDAERSRLLQALRAKGGTHERNYAIGLQKIPRFRDALSDLVQTELRQKPAR